jgi:hypothetical protein
LFRKFKGSDAWAAEAVSAGPATVRRTSVLNEIGSRGMMALPYRFGKNVGDFAAGSAVGIVLDKINYRREGKPCALAHFER